MELQVSVGDDKAELFLQILKEFKNDMVKKVKILDVEYISDEEQRDIEKILNSRTQEDKDIAFSKTISIDI